MRSRRTPRDWRADDRHHLPACLRAPSRCCRKRPRRDAAAIAALHGASFARGWSEQEVEGLLIDRHVIAHRAMNGSTHGRLHLVAAGRGRGGNPFGRGRKRAARTRAGAQAARSAFAPPRGPRRARRCSWKSTSTMRRRSGSMTAPVFMRYPAVPTTMRAPAARAPQRWCCAAIWSDRRPLGML